MRPKVAGGGEVNDKRILPGGVRSASPATRGKTARIDQFASSAITGTYARLYHPFVKPGDKSGIAVAKQHLARRLDDSGGPFSVFATRQV